MWPLALLTLLAAGTPVNVAHWKERAGSSARPLLGPKAPVHFTVVLRPGDPDGLATFLQRVQDPAAPEYRQFLTPAEFGNRFGARAPDYDRVESWLEAAGFQVATYDGRTALSATGTHAQLTSLLGVQLRRGTDRNGGPKVAVTGTARAPDPIARQILLIEGLDSESPWRPALALSGGNAMGPQDLRRFYNSAPLLAEGISGQGAQLVTLISTGPGDAAAAAAVEFFYSEFSDSSARFVRDILPNPADVAPVVGGWYEESALDVEMLSVGAPLASTVTLVVPPANELFSTGISEIVNHLPGTTVANMSIAGCEAYTSAYYPDLANGVMALRTLLQQGLAEGITWFAASGDAGSDPCADGAPAVDFPSSLPEVVAVGGTQFTATFDVHNAITSYSTESVWNDDGAGGGGGQSSVFSKPSWQVGVTPPDGARDVPDLAALAGPPWDIYADFPRTPQAVGGTSASSPMTAGFFALIAQQSGCKLGDIHQQLYTFGASQLDGGPAVFHDVTQGDNQVDSTTGYPAGPGYDLATGWGSIDVAALAAAWPACPGADAGPGSPYDACVALQCDAGTCATTLEGPSSCVPPCSGQDTCSSGEFCSFLVSGGTGCIAGCDQDSDCSSGEHCYVCGGICEASNPDATIGAPCQGDSDCAPGEWCISDASGAPFGLCTADCNLCGVTCPGNSVCSTSFQLCFPPCTGAQGDCRAGYGCQQLDPMGANLCFPGCGSDADCTWAPGTSCEVPDGGTSGSTVCLYPDGGVAEVMSSGVDAGVDAGPAIDAGIGAKDAGPRTGGDAGSISGSPGGAAPSRAAGCTCGSGPEGSQRLLEISFALMSVRRFRARRSVRLAG